MCGRVTIKLFYFKDKSGCRNFGDDLNPWIFDQLLPGFFDDDGSELFVGIGTILNDEIPRARKTHVFSSGAGYGGLPAMDSTWEIHCVRGPLTAERLKLPKSTAITDGAALLSRIYKKPPTASFHKFSFMPHVFAAEAGGLSWKRVCDELGIGYIDPRNPVQAVLDILSATEVLITEAMHGAIVAETLRIPWVPVVTNEVVLDFKWRDWCASLGLDYVPEKLFPLWDSGPKTPVVKAKKYVKHRLAVSRLKKIMREGRPVTSGPGILEELTERLEERLYALK